MGTKRYKIGAARINFCDRPMVKSPHRQTGDPKLFQTETLNGVTDKMNKTTKSLIAAGAVALSLGALAAPSFADRDRGDCGPRGGHHMMHKGGMGFFGEMRDRDLTEAEIRTLSEAFLLMRGNDNLKVGAIKTLENGNFSVDIVTKDDSLVKNVEVDKRSGRPAYWDRKDK